MRRGDGGVEDVVDRRIWRRARNTCISSQNPSCRRRGSIWRILVEPHSSGVLVASRLKSGSQCRRVKRLCRDGATSYSSGDRWYRGRTRRASSQLTDGAYPMHKRLQGDAPAVSQAGHYPPLSRGCGQREPGDLLPGRPPARIAQGLYLFVHLQVIVSPVSSSGNHFSPFLPIESTPAPDD